MNSHQEQPENFLEERRIAKEVIESFGFLEAWVFEDEGASATSLENSYLEPLQESSIVVVILGQHLTAPVLRECAEARAQGLRILILLKDVPQRDPEVMNLIASANVKFARFDGIESFRTELKKALEGEVVRALQQRLEEHPASKIERQLRDLLANHRFVHVRPAVPSDFNTDLYEIETLDAEEVVVKKGSGHTVTIPIDRIAIVPTGPGEPTLLQVDGRVQWLTARRFWQFLPEKPADGFGIGKAASPGDRHVVKLQERLKLMGRLHAMEL
jgi:hypothetical protein